MSGAPRVELTPAEAVVRLRKLALHAEGDDGDALVILIAHVGELERIIEQARASHDSAFKYTPAYAVHLVNSLQPRTAKKTK